MEIFLFTHNFTSITLLAEIKISLWQKYDCCFQLDIDLFNPYIGFPLACIYLLLKVSISLYEAQKVK